MKKEKEELEVIQEKKPRTKVIDCKILVKKSSRCVVNLNGTMLSIPISKEHKSDFVTIEYTGKAGAPDFKIISVK